MARGVIDIEGINSPELQSLKSTKTPDDIPFCITKIGHVVLKVKDLERSVNFYTQILGFRVSDAYPENMMPGRMVFMRCNRDHHGVALVGGAPSNSSNLELHHMAFEVSTIDEVLKAREHLIKNNVQIQFEGRRRAGAQVAVEFLDPDGHWLEIFWGLDQIAPDAKARPPEEWVEVFSLEDAIDNAPLGQNTKLKDRKLRKN
ncbi:VOC family protein [Rhodospirillales bacterium]|nr:VOC family protein [Rhodospirillales bacterium]